VALCELGGEFGEERAVEPARSDAIDDLPRIRPEVEPELGIGVFRQDELFAAAHPGERRARRSVEMKESTARRRCRSGSREKPSE
jgi:hypothetical protein